MLRYLISSSSKDAINVVAEEPTEQVVLKMIWFERTLPFLVFWS